MIDSEVDVFAYLRTYKGKKYLVVANLSDEENQFKTGFVCRDLLIHNENFLPELSQIKLKAWEAFAWTRRRRALSNLGTTHPENQTTQGGASKEGTTCRTPPPPNPRRVLGFQPGSGTGMDTGDLSGASKEKGDARMRPHRRGRRSDQGFPPDSRYATGTPPAPELAAKAADRTQPEGRSEQRMRRSSTFRSGAERPRHDHHPPDPRRPSSRRLRPSHPAHAACRRGCAASPSGAAAPESAVLRAETQRREASPPPSSAPARACQASLRWRRGEEM